MRSPCSTSAWTVSELDVPKNSMKPPARALQAQIGGGVLLHVVQHGEDGQGPDARRSERPFAVRPHRGVDDAAVVVRADGDAAVDVGDDEIAVLVAAAELRGVRLGNGLLVQHVRMGETVDAPEAGEARELSVLVGVLGVHHEGGAAEFPPELVREHCTEARGVDRAADVRGKVRGEAPVDRDDAAELRVAAVAAPAVGIDQGRVDAFLLQRVEDDRAAKRDLVGDVRELQQDGRVVEQVLLEKGRLVLEQTHLGRRRPGVDRQNLHSTHLL